MQNTEDAVHNMPFQHIRPELFPTLRVVFTIDMTGKRVAFVKTQGNEEIETHNKASIVNWREISKTFKIFPDKHFKLLVTPDKNYLSIY